MSYLLSQTLFFLVLAALLGFVIGCFWRGRRFQSELRDLDARWRADKESWGGRNGHR